MAEVDKLANEELSREAAELTERLEAARKRRSVAAAQLAHSELEELKARVEAEERAARNEAAVAEAVAKHGAMGVKLDVVDVPDGRIVIVKRPHPVAFKAFQDLERVTVEETEKLVRPCVEFPDKAEYDALADEYPGVVSTAAIKVCALAGVRKVELRGK